MIEFIKEFPREKYKVINSPNGLFYIDIVPDHSYTKYEIRSGYANEGHFFTLLPSLIRKGTDVVDVGAHIGTISNVLSDIVGPSQTVYAFEPDAIYFRELYENTLLNKKQNMKLFYCAVGKEEAILPSTGICGVASFHPVQVVSLDSLNLTNISFIKVDIEGMEEDFLYGAEATLKRERPNLIIEICGGFDIDTAPHDVQAIIRTRMQILESFGYVLTKIGGHDYIAIPKEHINEPQYQFIRCIKNGRYTPLG